LAQVAAVALFLEHAQAIKPGFTLTQANACTIAEICIRLDGLPLAIELAAACIKLLPPQALLAHLEHRLAVLTRSACTLPHRLQLLGTIREYGLECLQACGELEATRRAHAAYYLRLSEEAVGHLTGMEAGKWFALLEQEHENLQAAFQWALEYEDNEAGASV